MIESQGIEFVVGNFDNSKKEKELLSDFFRNLLKWANLSGVDLSVYSVRKKESENLRQLIEKNKPCQKKYSRFFQSCFKSIFINSFLHVDAAKMKSAIKRCERNFRLSSEADVSRCAEEVVADKGVVLGSDSEDRYVIMLIDDGPFSCHIAINRTGEISGFAGKISSGNSGEDEKEFKEMHRAVSSWHVTIRRVTGPERYPWLKL